MKTPISKSRNMRAAALAAVALIFCACSTETALDDAPRPSVSDTGTTFVLSAAAQSHAATRAIEEGSAFDTMVEDITVLLFDAGTKKYVRYVRRYLSAGDFQPLPGGAGTERRLKFTAGIPNGNYIALFVANAAEMIDTKYDLAAGTVTQGGGDMKALEIGDVEGVLVREFGGKYDADPASTKYTPFVMSSGREALTLPLASATHYLDNPVRLARDVAKINVRFVSPEVADRFKISEIRLCNYNTRSFFVGTADLWNMWNKAKENGDKAGVTNALYTAAASRPAASIVSGYASAIVYDNSDPAHHEIDGNGQCVDEIFTAEQPFAANGKEKDNLCLLVGGRVTIDGTDYGTRWYKLALIRKDAKGVQHYVNVLRNYVYTLNITAVEDSGYESPERAYNEHPGNLAVDLDVVDEDGLNNVVYNGHYYLAVTRNEYEFSCISELAKELKIHTDYPEGWKISPAPEAWPDWLKEEWQWKAGASGSKGVTAADRLWASVNLKDEQREFAFTVTAGPLSQRIVVRQKPNAYVFATPGVAGIRMSDYRGLLRARAGRNDPAWLDPTIKLTLKGSSTYAGTIVDKPQVTGEFGGLEAEPVYTVNTVFGSTVAILFGNFQGWKRDGSSVVWTNPEYSGSTVGPLWENGPVTEAYASTVDTDYDIADNPAKGHGDICRAISNGVYRIPRGNPWRLADGTLPFGDKPLQGENWWEKASSKARFRTKDSPDAIDTGVGDCAILSDKGETIFLPAAGLNDRLVGSYVYYRTSTSYKEKYSSIFAADSRHFSFNAIITSTGTMTSLPVRCVKAAPKPVVAKGMKTYGWGQINNTAGYIMQPGAGTRKIVDAPINFGTDDGSAVKIERYSPASTFDHSLLTYGDAYDPAKIREMFDRRPDIVLTGFDIDVSATKQAEVAGYMMDYLKAGGTMILALEHPGLSQAFFEALFPGSTINITWRTTNTFRIENVGDAITKGPFGDIGGRSWGNDSNGTRAIGGIPEDDVVVYSRDENGSPTMFRHKVYNLMFIGDGGAFANYDGTPGENAGTTAVTTHPLAFDADGRPITRTNWMIGNNVENGRLFANIMAWAVKQADTNGINKK